MASTSAKAKAKAKAKEGKAKAHHISSMNYIGVHRSIGEWRYYDILLG